MAEEVQLATDRGAGGRGPTRGGADLLAVRGPEAVTRRLRLRDRRAAPEPAGHARHARAAAGGLRRRRPGGRPSGSPWHGRAVTGRPTGVVAEARRGVYLFRTGDRAPSSTCRSGLASSGVRAHVPGSSSSACRASWQRPSTLRRGAGGVVREATPTGRSEVQQRTQAAGQLREAGVSGVLTYSDDDRRLHAVRFLAGRRASAVVRELPPASRAGASARRRRRRLGRARLGFVQVVLTKEELSRFAASLAPSRTRRGLAACRRSPGQEARGPRRGPTSRRRVAIFNEKRLHGVLPRSSRGRCGSAEPARDVLGGSRVPEPDRGRQVQALGGPIPSVGRLAPIGARVGGRQDDAGQPSRPSDLPSLPHGATGGPASASRSPCGIWTGPE